MPTWRLLDGDARVRLRDLPDDSVHMVVTSPPYWGLRAYAVEPTVWGGNPACVHAWGPQERGRRKDLLPGEATACVDAGGTSPYQADAAQDGGRYCGACRAWRGHLGLEPDPASFVDHLVEVFREVRRVLRPDGTCWVMLGDSYANDPGNGRAEAPADGGKPHRSGSLRRRVEGLKHKDLIGVPWRAAFALQADGWWLRSGIVWAKRNSLPESVEDRPTMAHEFVFLLAKRARYFYDGFAIREPIESGPSDVKKMTEGRDRIGGLMKDLDDPLMKVSSHTDVGRKRAVGDPAMGRNCRSVWSVASEPFPGAHFAVFPRTLAARCVLAGTSERGCCAACGRPLQRVVEKVRAPDTKAGESAMRGAGHFRDSDNGPANRDGRAFEVVVEARTVGWKPTCGCGPDAGVRPCVVLDPFAGSGDHAPCREPPRARRHRRRTQRGVRRDGSPPPLRGHPPLRRGGVTRGADVCVPVPLLTGNTIGAIIFGEGGESHEQASDAGGEGDAAG